MVRGGDEYQEIVRNVRRRNQSLRECDGVKDDKKKTSDEKESRRVRER